MKKTGIVVSALLVSGIISGQQTFDYLLKAKALISSGKPAQAIEILSSAINEKNDSRLLSERAEAYIINGNYQDAIADLNAANSLIENSGEFGLARVYAMKGDAVTSLYHLELNLKSAFRKSEKEIMLDPAFSRIESRTEWRSFWKKEWYSDLEESMSEIEYYISSRKTAEAESVYSRIRNSYPGHEEILYADAIINISSGRFAEAIKSLSGLLVSYPDNEKYLRAFARAQTSTSNFAGASATYSKMISLEIPDAGLLMLRAECYFKTGETDKARSDIRQYMSVYPEDKNALRMAGKLEVASGNNLKALEYFSENLRLHPNDPQCYIDRANSYLISKSWEWAIKDYSMSLDLDPDNPETWLNKGIALVNSGNTIDACHDLRVAFSLGNKKASEYISRYCIK